MGVSGRDVPWRLSIFFCFVPPEAHELVDPPSSQSGHHQILAVLGGQNDPWYAPGKVGLPERYSQLTVLEHQDGHGFPFTEPMASQVYNTVSAKIREVCGL